MKDGKVGYSGPTYIAIRSAKHDNSTAKTHSFDFDQLTQLDSFKPAMMSDGEVKPLVFVGVDGGPDEAPGNNKTLDAWVDCFRKHIYLFSFTFE